MSNKQRKFLKKYRIRGRGKKYANGVDYHKKIRELQIKMLGNLNETILP